ncbi:MAG TPA: hypothetical protein VMI35_13510 [Puia sp.]|nr:hypothetical protein [Puia sp.]
MNLRDALLEEHSKKQCDRIVRYIGDDPTKFDALMQLFFQDEYRITQRAAWPMSYCVKQYPELVCPYIGKLLNNLQKPRLHDAVKRNTVRLFQGIKIPRKFHGKLMTTCFDFIQSNETAVAIKAFSLSILGNLSKQYPEILPELNTIIKERWDLETAAFRSRARKIRKTGS